MLGRQELERTLLFTLFFTSDSSLCPLAGTKLYCLVTEAHVSEQLNRVVTVNKKNDDDDDDDKLHTHVNSHFPGLLLLAGMPF